jgi:signal transduction histidine kinase
LDITDGEALDMNIIKDNLNKITILNKGCSLNEFLIAHVDTESQINLQIQTENGRYKSFEATCNPIELDGRNCLLTIIKDQTDFEELTKERMNEKFQKILIASVTHEIRTPINIQQGMLDMIECIFINCVF